LIKCEWNVSIFIVAVLMLFTPLEILASDAVSLATKNVVEQIKIDEAMLVEALKAADSVQLEKLSWSNREASFIFARNDPKIGNDEKAKVKLRPYITCANLHSKIGLLASILSRAVLTNSGGENTRTDHQTELEGLKFFLKFFHEKRILCQQLSNTKLGEETLATDPQKVLKSFKLLSPRRIEKIETDALIQSFEIATAFEQTLANNNTRFDSLKLLAFIAPIHRILATLNALDDPNTPRATSIIVKECRWMIGDIGSLLATALERTYRPDFKNDSELANRMPQYRQQTKPACARSLGLSAKYYEVAIPTGALGLEPNR
jgi:hypothetical protein